MDEKVCEWTRHKDGQGYEHYASSCDAHYDLSDNQSPFYMGFVYCPYCGKLMIDVTDYKNFYAYLTKK